MASADTLDSIYLHGVANNPAFQQRCWLRFLILSFGVLNAASTATASAVTAAGDNTITFTATPANIVGLIASDVTLFPIPSINPIPPGVKVASVTATTAVLDHNVIGDGIAIGDLISFGPVSHAERKRFTAALFTRAVDMTLLAYAVLADPTNRTNCLADRSTPGGNITDAGIDTQVNLVFTGLATVRNW